MLDIFDYLIGWAIYIAAGAICYIIFYRFTGSIGFKPLANSLRAILIAIMFTPWYISPEEDLLAPAIIVMMLDLITVGGTSFVRAMVPLTMAIVLAVFVALAGRLIRQGIAQRKHSSE
ncbi:MAG: hypothetical protein V4751_01295 [Pseudomonadota bacterium]